MKSEFVLAFNEITEVRGLPREVVLDALKTALISAYRRDVGASSAQRIEAEIDSNTGQARIYVEKEVVEEVKDKRTEVSLEEARKYKPDAEIGDMVMVLAENTTRNFGRIAAQTAKQVILQRIREAEREAQYEEYVEREGEIVNGTIQSVGSQAVTISLDRGRAEAILPRNQMVPGERYRPLDKLRVYVLEVRKSPRGPQIIVSRSHRNMLRRLLEYEVPEIYNGQVEIKSIAREAGQRSKVAVAAIQEGVDPVGACVGMRGVRIQSIVRELNNEKIDVIEWNPDQAVFIAKALSPARVSSVHLDNDPEHGRTAIVIVPEDQLSLAIGREGQNARLAAKLTGWRIDIKSIGDACSEAMEVIDTEAWKPFVDENAAIVEEVRRLMAKKEVGRPIMPEEYKTMARFAALAEDYRIKLKQHEREVAAEESGKPEEPAVPEVAYQIPIDRISLPEKLLDALRKAGYKNAGEVMEQLDRDESKIMALVGIDSDMLEALRQLLKEAMEAGPPPPEPEPEPAPEEAETTPAEEPEPAQQEEQAETQPVPEPEATAEQEPEKTFEVPEFVPDEFPFDDFEEEDELETGRRKKKRKRKKSKRRRDEYGEKPGPSGSRKRWRPGRGRWEDFE